MRPAVCGVVAGLTVETQQQHDTGRGGAVTTQLSAAPASGAQVLREHRNDVVNRSHHRAGHDPHRPPELSQAVAGLRVLMSLPRIRMMLPVVLDIDPELRPHEIAASDPLAFVDDVEVQPRCGQVGQLNVDTEYGLPRGSAAWVCQRQSLSQQSRPSDTARNDQVATQTSALDQIHGRHKIGQRQELAEVEPRAAGIRDWKGADSRDGADGLRRVPRDPAPTPAGNTVLRYVEAASGGCDLVPPGILTAG